MNIESILFEIFNEAKNGKVVIDEEEWPISFSTKIYNDKIIEYKTNSNVELVIKNFKKFIKVLEEYVKVELAMDRKAIRFFSNSDYNKIKLIITYAFVNATYEDMKEPIVYFEKLIKFIKDNTFESLNDGINIKLNNNFYNSILYIKNSKQSLLMETPYKMEFILKSEDDDSLQFKLPEISYGIVDNNGKKECYIYSILNKENTDNEKKTKYQKTISRLLYKLNNGVMDFESDEFKDYKENKSDYYPENITDVSVSSILSLYIFVLLLNRKGIFTIKGVPYLPIRYNSRDIVADNIDDDIKKETLKNRNDTIQYNVTNKFIRLFNRMQIHFNVLEVESYPYEFDEFITCKINNIFKSNNNVLLDEIDKNIHI